MTKIRGDQRDHRDHLRYEAYALDHAQHGDSEPVSYTHLTLPTICSV